MRLSSSRDGRSGGGVRGLWSSPAEAAAAGAPPRACRGGRCGRRTGRVGASRVCLAAWLPWRQAPQQGRQQQGGAATAAVHRITPSQQTALPAAPAAAAAARLLRKSCPCSHLHIHELRGGRRPQLLEAVQVAHVRCCWRACKPIGKQGATVSLPASRRAVQATLAAAPKALRAAPPPAVLPPARPGLSVRPLTVHCRHYLLPLLLPPALLLPPLALSQRQLHQPAAAGEGCHAVCGRCYSRQRDRRAKRAASDEGV